jgi:hypothetical protein
MFRCSKVGGHLGKRLLDCDATWPMWQRTTVPREALVQTPTCIPLQQECTEFNGGKQHNLAVPQIPQKFPH